MTAPERIWAGRYHGTWWQSTPHHQMTEYIRADIVGKSHNSLSAALELPEIKALVDALRAADRHLANGHDKMAHNITRAALRAIEGDKP